VLRDPPYVAFTPYSRPGEYHGFFWFFFINEQLLRFLNLRYPRDYNTVPRVYFWLLNAVWLFPWSVYFPAALKLSFKPLDRAGRTRLLALCWAGLLLVFFTFSTTQEYYSMPCYPALALLLGSGMAAGGKWVQRGTRWLSVVLVTAFLAVVVILFLVRRHATPGDISIALSAHPGAYTLSLGHMQDLTIRSFAYLRLPLGVAAVAQVHRRLYTSHDLKSVLLNQYLDALLEDLRRSAEGNKMSRLTLKAEPIEIDPDRAVAIGIIVNELVMNAVKYAYPDGAGPIHVDLRAQDDDLVLSIADDGVGLNVKTDPRSTGMGQRIVTAMATKLDASVERDPAAATSRSFVARKGAA